MAIVERIEGEGQAVETPIGFTPTPDALDLTGLEVSSEDIEDLLKVDRQEWASELTDIEEWFGRFGESLPASIQAALHQLRQRVNS